MIGCGISFFVSPSSAESSDYFELDPEQLLNLEVISVSKKAEKVSEAPAAIYVITGEDIARFGFTSIPDALRMAPGVQVAQNGPNTYTISIRGFDNGLSNKLLVLMDGRPVYNPIYGGTYWEAQDTLMQDIDRIEVIRGPGGTLWGANAVNGVINIITKNAKDTVGEYVTAGFGDHENGFLSARHGDDLENGYYRVYGKTFDRDANPNPDGSTKVDGLESGRGGFRADWNNNFTLQGDFYRTFSHQLNTAISLVAPFSPTISEDILYQGANILGHWKNNYDDGSALNIQSYIDYAQRDEIGLLDDERTNFDIETQYDFAQKGKHALTLGAGYKYSLEDEDGSTNLIFTPDDRGENLFSTFIQDKITLSPDIWFLTVGSKVEHNNYTGFEVEPNVRLEWLPDEQQTVWAAISRAVRTPTTFERDITFNALSASGPTLYTFIGNEDFISEELVAYEIGYRNQITSDFSVDVASFYNDYSNLAAIALLPSSIVNDGINPIYTSQPFDYQNAITSEVYGGEITSSWNVRDNWKLSASYSKANIYMHANDTPGLFRPESTEGGTPQNQAQIRSSWNINSNWTMDNALYYIDETPLYNIGDYYRFDTNIGWKISDNFRFNLVGQNLIGPSHREFGAANGINATEVERSIYGRLTWQFR